MSANLIPGKEIASRIQEEVKEKLEELKTKGINPKLVAVQVGENPASAVYVKAQAKSCEKLGIKYSLQQLPAETQEKDLIATLQALNADSTVTGIILQLPLPQGIDVKKVQSFISPVKDVEGVNPTNMGWIVYGKPGLAPCTALAVKECIEYTGVNLYGKELVMVGHSDIVGKPVALLALDKFATTTVCHIGTGERGYLPEHVKRAEILIVAVGKANLIKGEWVKEGAIVIDVGINRVGDKIVGDVEFEVASQRASWITPVPGGVGSVTTAMLLRNVIKAAENL